METSLQHWASNPAVEPHHHHHQTQTQSVEKEETKQQQQPERVVKQQSKKKGKKLEKKQPQRGLGVAKLEILRMEEKLKKLNEDLEQLQVAGGSTVVLPPHQQHQFQVPFPPFVDPRHQYHPNGIIPVPFGRFVPGKFAGTMKDDPPHHPHLNFVFQPMNRIGNIGGYPGEPMNMIGNGGFSGQPINIIGNGGFPGGEPINIIGNGGLPGHEPNNIIGNGGLPGGGVSGGFGVNGVCSNQIAVNPYMFLDQQLRIQNLKLLHSARELYAMQRMHYHLPQHSNFSAKRKPIINCEQPKSKEKMAMNSCDSSLDLSLGSKTNIDEKIKKDSEWGSEVRVRPAGCSGGLNVDDDDDEEVEAMDIHRKTSVLGEGRRRRRRSSSSSSSSSSVLMEYEFFPGESSCSDNRRSSFAGGGVVGSEASTSNNNTHLLDLSLKLSL